MLRCFSAIFAILALAVAAPAQQVQDFARLSGQGRSVIWGIGLVTGLNNTGDSGKELATARPLAIVLWPRAIAATAAVTFERPTVRQIAARPQRIACRHAVDARAAAGIIQRKVAELIA